MSEHRTFFRPYQRKRQERYEPAGTLYAPLLAKAVEARTRGDWDACVGFIGEIFAKHGPQPYPCLLNLSLMRRGQQKAELRLGYEALAAQWPAWIHGRMNAGLLLAEDGEYLRAIRHFRKVLQIDEHNQYALLAMGMALLGLGRIEEAKRYFRQALEYIPPDTKALFRCRFAFAYLGRFDLFMQHEELRWECEDDYAYDHGIPPGNARRAELWLGEPLAGKSILVLDEQGAGDTIQYARWLVRLTEEADQVWLRLKQPHLATLITAIAPKVQIVGHLEPLPICDHFVGLLSLFHRFSMIRRETPAFPQAYIPRGTVSPSRYAICWAGAKSHPRDQLRSMTWAQAAEFIGEIHEAVGEVEWLDVTVGRERPDEPDEPFVTPLVPVDYADTAAQLATCHALVTVDTSVAHVAGGLGIPTALLVATAPDVRWGAEGDTTPWYDSVRIFRQEKPREWATPLAQAKGWLMDLIDRRGDGDHDPR